MLVNTAAERQLVTVLPLMYISSTVSCVVSINVTNCRFVLSLRLALLGSFHTVQNLDTTLTRHKKMQLYGSKVVFVIFLLGEGRGEWSDRSVYFKILFIVLGVFLLYAQYFYCMSANLSLHCAVLLIFLIFFMFVYLLCIVFYVLPFGVINDDDDD